MNTELKVKRLEQEQKLAGEMFDLAKSLIAQPATGLLIGYISLKGLNKLGVLTTPESAILGALIGSATMVNALKPDINRLISG